MFGLPLGMSYSFFLTCFSGQRVKPFFLALKSKYWDQFAAGIKTVEWRAYGARFNERVLLPGRRVVLSCGYTGLRLYAVVTAVEVVDRAGAPRSAERLLSALPGAVRQDQP
jgi:hypothetical protein